MIYIFNKVGHSSCSPGLAPKGHISSSPGHRPGNRDHARNNLTVQQAKSSPREPSVRWTVNEVRFSSNPQGIALGWKNFKHPVCSLFMMLMLPFMASGLAVAQEHTALEAAANLEKILVDSIARSEKSVVAIARVRRQAEGKPADVRPDPFNRPIRPLNPPQPTDPDFIPNEFDTGEQAFDAQLVRKWCAKLLLGRRSSSAFFRICACEP
jgi:hypothetical protein